MWQMMLQESVRPAQTVKHGRAHVIPCACFACHCTSDLCCVQVHYKLSYVGLQKQGFVITHVTDRKRLVWTNQLKRSADFWFVKHTDVHVLQPRNYITYITYEIRVTLNLFIFIILHVKWLSLYYNLCLVKWHPEIKNIIMTSCIFWKPIRREGIE